VVQKDARIAQAAADREATEREQEANALKSEAVRSSQIKQAGYQAEVDRAAAQAAQAGPLADAEAKQQVVQTETAVAKLEAQREEQRLQSTVNRPADAEAYKQVTLAKAAKEARVLDAEAEGQAIKVKGENEAGVLRVRADALKANQQALVTQQLAEHLPEIVTAATRSLTGANLTVLNGGEGLADLVGQVVGQGFTLFQGLRQGLGIDGAADNGPASEGARREEDRPAVEKAVGTAGPGGRPKETAGPGGRPTGTAGPRPNSR
jgi:LysM repeat protein